MIISMFKKSFTIIYLQFPCQSLCCLLQNFVYICVKEWKTIDYMKITLLVVGKTDVKWVKEGPELYISRLQHYVPFSLLEIPELKNVSSLGKEQIKLREGDLILKSVKPSDMVVLMDERGKQYTSMEFSAFIQGRMLQGGKDMVFVIGGAYGFSEAVYSRSDLSISLSKMTFSHQMVRTIFVEQLYRAFTIIKGEPYHHE